MRPIYQHQNGRWYFKYGQQEYGPYFTEEAAWAEYYYMSNRQCPTCEE